MGIALVTAALADSERADEAIVRELSRSAAAATRWPLDEEVRQQILGHPLYGWISRQRIAMLLSELELVRRATAQTEDVALLNQALSIEHILPQTWQETWPLADENGGAVERRQRSLDVLGNLTIVTGSLNSGLSNQPWSQKRERLGFHSVLLLNRELASSEEWNEEAITARGQRLWEEIVGVWQGPEWFRPDFDPAALEGPTGEHAASRADMPPNEIAEVFTGGSALFQALLIELAEYPDERRTYSNVEAALGWSRGRLASVLGGYGNRAGRYDGRRPFRLFKEPDGTWWIWVDSGQAGIIRNLASAQSH